MSASTVTAEPGTRVSRGWTTRFALLWFGLWTANLAPVQLVLPNQFDRLDHAHKVRDFGVVSGATGVVALLALPLFGALCDRTRSRWGRRRVWVAAASGSRRVSKARSCSIRREQAHSQGASRVAS